MLTKGGVILHGNAWFHNACTSTTQDIFLLSSLQLVDLELTTHCFETYAEFMNGVNYCLCPTTTCDPFFDEGLQEECWLRYMSTA